MTGLGRGVGGLVWTGRYTARVKVVITGIGMIGSLGATRDAGWARALAGEARMGPPRGIDEAIDGLKGVVVARVRDTELRERLRALDERGLPRAASGRYRQMAAVAAAEAMDDAGLGDLADEASGGDPGGAVVMGGIASGTIEIERITLRVHDGQRPRLADNLGKRTSIAVQDVARVSGVRGPSFAVDAACTSGAVALAQGRRVIAAGDADWCLAGGVEVSLTASNLMPARSLRAVTTRYAQEPNRASRPFDAKRCGFVPAEGACFLLLESADRAAARGAAVYAELVAATQGVDVTHPTQLDPGFIADLMRRAIDRSGLSPGDVSWVKAHATSTPQGDATEAHAIGAVFGEEGVPVWAPKSLIGHMMAGAGAVETALSALAVRHDTIPPTINLDAQDHDCPVRVITESTPAADATVLCNSFGFGGPGVCLLLRKAQAPAAAL